MSTAGNVCILGSSEFMVSKSFEKRGPLKPKVGQNNPKIDQICDFLSRTWLYFYQYVYRTHMDLDFN